MCGIISVYSCASDDDTSPCYDPPRDIANVPEDLLRDIPFSEFFLTYSSTSRSEAWAYLVRLISSFSSGPNGPKAETGLHLPGSLTRRDQDLRWRIEKDLLELVDAVSLLLNDPDRSLPANAVRAGWGIELALRALSRLEVRGRDSAGLAFVVWSDSAQMQPRSHTQESNSSPHTLVRHTTTAAGAQILTYKVAEEVGALGYNDSILRKLISGDSEFQAIVRTEPSALFVLGHTRWASAGAISTANAHPIDGSRCLLKESGDPGRLIPVDVDTTVAAINGDVDNYLSLRAEFEKDSRYTLPEDVTTDSKIVPVFTEFSTALSDDSRITDAVSRLEGSLACVLIRPEVPGRFWVFTRGTGQSLYAGTSGATCIVSSEVYGCLGLTHEFFPVVALKPEGDTGSVCLRISALDDRLSFFRLTDTKEPVSIKPTPELAEITTRDVDRRGYEHYFRKELEEAIESVTQTIVGRYTRGNSVAADATIEFDGLYSRGGDRFHARLRPPRKLSRFIFVGQGSAHVAGLAGAYFIEQHASHVGFHAVGMTGGEFSAHYLRTDLSDTCLIAISQSGTTTDTNRAVTLAQSRGALVVAIVNRRNSALAEAADVVIYTSDGRDVEMAVASTKAFYAQVVAAFLFAQNCAHVSGGLNAAQVGAALVELERLPALMDACFEREKQIRTLARQTALQRRHWSVLGSGTSRIAAQEIRIKMSELCYKTASLDYLEDKKHIDLSAEPLIVAPVFDLREDLIEDVAKEIAIFSAHNATPVVFCDRGGERYRKLTDYVIQVPPIGFALGIITSSLVGHLFAYHTALAIETTAERLREFRRKAKGGSATDGTSVRIPQSEVNPFVDEVIVGRFDAIWTAGLSVKLVSALRILSSGYDAVPLIPQEASDPGAWAYSVLEEIVADTTRPVDSVRHQAKTVTVGTTRSGFSRNSRTARALKELGVSLDDVPTRTQYLLEILDEALVDVIGAVLYHLENVTDFYAKTERLQLRVAKKIRSSATRASRFDHGEPISGTKALAVQRREPLIVRGLRDNAPVLIFPLMRAGAPAAVVLLHLTLSDQVSVDTRERLMTTLPHRCETLRAAVEESRGGTVLKSELAKLPLDVLLFSNPDDVNELSG